jgi:hypothetical protein
MKLTITLLLSLLILTACQNKEKEKSTAETRVYAAERETFFNSLKNPEEVAKIIPGLTGFDVSLLNDPQNFYRYGTGEVMAAANLGIYMADLNYCILFNQNEVAKRYFKAVYELSKIIQIEKGTLDFLMKRYEKNLTQHDSLRGVINELFEESTLGLQGTDRERLAGMAMAGYQIENLHLVLSTLNSFPEEVTAQQSQSKEVLLTYLLEQQGKFEVIYNFIRANSDPLDPKRNPNYPFFDNALRELIGLFNSLDKTKPLTADLGKKVDEIRNRIIEIK